MTPQTIGPYQVLEKLGEGGMGEVYKAHDPRLNRIVAIKILPQDQASSARKARFIQEARAASALNHPNIITIHDIVAEEGRDYIVMEFIAGVTLAEKIARQELRLPDTLKYAAQIAEALGRAHAAGIVHRDLKPSNVMIASGGLVKVLDFGLAKLKPAPAGLQESTLTVARTEPGMIVGTAGYMSPEQVRGEEVDHRSDIFSFGIVLHEMLSGQRPFQGQSFVEVANAILKEPPPELPDSVPAPLRHVVAGCLEKDSGDRLESARDLAFTLKALAAGPTSTGQAAKISITSGKGRRWLWPASAALFGLATAILAILHLTRPAPLDLNTYKYTPLATEAEPEHSGVWSPDGKSFAYLKSTGGLDRLMVRSLNAPSPVQLASIPASGTFNSRPFWSPDGERLYFGASSRLWSVAAAGGDPQQVLAASVNAAAISPDGKSLVYWGPEKVGEKWFGTLWVSSPPGSTPRKYVPAPFQTTGSLYPAYVSFSPDGSRIAVSGFRLPGALWLWQAPWPDGARARPRQIFANRRWGFGVPQISWMPDSRHVVIADGSLHMGNPDSGELRTIYSGFDSVLAGPAVSGDGQRLIFASRTTDHDLMEIPLDGSPPRAVLSTARREMHPSRAASGDPIAFITNRTGSPEIWARSAGGAWERPVVTEADFPDDEMTGLSAAAVSPDGSRIAFARTGAKSGFRIWISPAAGGRPAAAFGESVTATTGAPCWSPDGSSLAFFAIVDGTHHLAVGRLGSTQPTRLLPLGLCATAPAWSPDGQWVSCAGPVPRSIHLVSPDGARRREIPTTVSAAAGGSLIVWSRDSSTLYVAGSSEGRIRLDSVQISSGQTRHIAEYASAFALATGVARATTGSLAPDGKSFITTAQTVHSDIWMLEGFPQPRRPWFRFGF